MTSHLSDDVIGSICSGYVPFHTVVVVLNSFPRSRLRDWKNPSTYWISVNPFCELIAIEKASCGGDRTAVPSDEEFLRSERSTTELAGPGKRPTILGPKYQSWHFFHQTVPLSIWILYNI